MESQLSRNSLLKMGFVELKMSNSHSVLKFFKKKSFFLIFIEEGNFGYLLQKESALNDEWLEPIYTIEQLKTEYDKLASQELVLYSFSDN